MNTATTGLQPTPHPGWTLRPTSAGIIWLYTAQLDRLSSHVWTLAGHDEADAHNVGTNVEANMIEAIVAITTDTP
ncbi:hypothetical protein [Dactylosporangium sp. CA-233914]|uniref:hypothetical protein n=1 Tax=Dactylosporangium sp. CA-233914 TaxID=3239934 RepID=UPI003D8EFF2F